MEKAGYIEGNPGHLIRHARCGTPPSRALSEAEQKRLLATLAKAKGLEARRDRVLFEVMLAVGARLSSRGGCMRSRRTAFGRRAGSFPRRTLAMGTSPAATAAAAEPGGATSQSVKASSPFTRMYVGSTLE